MDNCTVHFLAYPRIFVMLIAAQSTTTGFDMKSETVR